MVRIILNNNGDLKIVTWIFIFFFLLTVVVLIIKKRTIRITVIGGGIIYRMLNLMLVKKKLDYASR